MLIYIVRQTVDGYRVAVYEDSALDGIQLHHADNGRMWQEEAQAEQRALELQQIPTPTYRIEALCCLACHTYTLFSDVGKHCLCCRACGCPTEGYGGKEGILATLLREHARTQAFPPA